MGAAVKMDERAVFVYAEGVAELSGIEPEDAGFGIIQYRHTIRSFLWMFAV